MKKHIVSHMAALLAVCLLLTSCAAGQGGAHGENPERQKDETKQYLTLVGNEPDTVDPQCTSEYYTVAMNTFDRLLEYRTDEDGTPRLEPSLAESWEVAENGRVYHFHMKKDVHFSNGTALTASDVCYTLTRLLTYPFSCHQDIALCIDGAEELMNGETTELAGFIEDGKFDFTIRLAEPNEAFLSSLATPGASILDEGTTEDAGTMFGRTARHTIGTGPFIFERWDAGESMRLKANPDCWSGAPQCSGVLVRFIPDADQQSLMFKAGNLDVLDLEKLGSEAEYFIHDETYKGRLLSAPHIGIAYIALNESFEPLNDVRVRKALQLALDRPLLLQAAFGGRGTVENGIFPYGLLGHNTQLTDIAYDEDEARRLLDEAGCADGFDLTLSISVSADEAARTTAQIIAAMWQRVGVRAKVAVISESAFRERRMAGRLACYYGERSAYHNDPDDFIYPFFGNAKNSRMSSLCYSDEAVMERVRKARGITEEAARLREYRELERRIVQEDAAWIPLFSRRHYFVINRRVQGFSIPWNGWFSSCYRDISIVE